METGLPAYPASAPPWRIEDLFCAELPSCPLGGCGTVLVTGASGYIGGRLVPELLERGYRVRAMVRADPAGYDALWPGAEVVVADALKADSLQETLEGVDTAYYLLHSLLLGLSEFAAADLAAARNFRIAAESCGVRRIIYLGGLGDVQSDLSSHLRSRMEVSEELCRGPVPVTILRAAIIIGSGSASYEIIHHLVRNLRVLPVPHWAHNRCQPIGIRDVIKYMVGVLENPESAGRMFDIGGPDVLTYLDMMKVVARLLNRRVLFVPNPLVPNLQVYAYVTSLLTPVPAPITRALIAGLRNEVVCREDAITELVPFERLGYEEAIVRAMDREEQDNVHTRWSGAYPPAHELAMKLRELGRRPTFTATYSLSTEKSAAALFTSICRVGGSRGWFRSNWMWRLRGAIDRVLLGVGMSRGRRSENSLHVNDVIDFWRVEELEPNRRLLLRAEMKLSGKAWLGFDIDDQGARRVLTVNGYFHTDTLSGKAYWYALMPFHGFIFRDLLVQLDRVS